MINSKRRVMLIDDSELDRTILKTMIEDEFEVLEYSNGYLAFEVLSKKMEHVDGILLDISMPIITGFDMLRLMKDNQLDDIPVFMITGEATQENVIKASEFKIAGFFSKPFDREEILKRLRAWLGVEIPFDLSKEDIEDTFAYIAELRTIYQAHLKAYDKKDVHYRHMAGIMKVLLSQYVKIEPESSLSKENIEIVSEAAYFCNIGEMVFPDRLDLTVRKGDIGQKSLQMLTEMGAKIIRLNHKKSCEYFVNICSNMCMYHNERFDGRGFPFGISGNRISVFNQLCHLVDVFDTRISKLYGSSSLHVNNVIKSMLRTEGIVDPKLLDLLELAGPGIAAYYHRASSEE